MYCIATTSLQDTSQRAAAIATCIQFPCWAGGCGRRAAFVGRWPWSQGLQPSHRGALALPHLQSQLLQKALLVGFAARGDGQEGAGGRVGERKPAAVEVHDVVHERGARVHVPSLRQHRHQRRDGARGHLGGPPTHVVPRGHQLGEELGREALGAPGVVVEAHALLAVRRAGERLPGGVPWLFRGRQQVDQQRHGARGHDLVAELSGAVEAAQGRHDLRAQRGVQHLHHLLHDSCSNEGAAHADVPMGEVARQHDAPRAGPQVGRVAQ
mmetsp:Transcript_35574/g.92417  ORF Transcript_35574/g.92417 Transcript_35574/m.92417 type:complete len:268 (-) Transcript_35574:1734-2537(-)